MERRFRFFGGKGGVGKTTCAAAWAVGRAREGARVLVASTDPAHSLGDALDVALGGEPVAVEVGGGRSFRAVEVAGEAAFRRWLGERREGLLAIAERGSLLVREQAERLLGLPMPGADELVGLLEVVRVAEAGGCEEVVVDTAPTGHTLRLLESPQVLRRLADLLAAVDERHRVLAATFGGGAGGPEPALVRLEEEARFLVDLLRDPRRSRFVWVTTAEALAVEEARDAFAALARLGVPVAEVVVDRWPAASGGAARRAAEAAAIAELAALAPGVPFRHVPELAAEPRGPAGLEPVAAALVAPARRGEELARVAREPAGTATRAADGGEAGTPRAGKPGRAAGGVSAGRGEGTAAAVPPGRAAGDRAAPTDGEEGSETAGAVAGTRAPGAEPAAPPHQDGAAPAPAWLDDLLPPGLALLLVGGKGGVGKTTCAATIALLAAAARPQRPVRLVSVDPAHSLADVLGQPLGDEPRPVAGAGGDLVGREVDAPAAWARLRGRLAGDLDRLLGWGDARSGGAATIDREVLRRLLETTPPGIDELVALVEIAEAAGAADDGADEEPPLVIVDTAPTGHTLRLLEMPELALAWVQALMAILLDLREAFGLGALAGELVALSRRLRAFQALRGDPVRCRFLLVRRGGELPRRESERLAAALDRLGVSAAGAVEAAVPAEAWEAAVGSASGPTSPPARPRAGGALRLLAPATYPPPRGVAALGAWGRTWRREPAAAP